MTRRMNGTAPDIINKNSNIDLNIRVYIARNLSQSLGALQSPEEPKIEADGRVRRAEWGFLGGAASPLSTS